MNDKQHQSADRDAELVRSRLRREFPRSDAYRYNAASIRVRVIDKRFSRRNRIDREKLVESLLEELPKRVQDDIIFLALLAPDELDQSILNAEFESPDNVLS